MVKQPGFDFSGFDKPGDESEVSAKFWRTAKKAARHGAEPLTSVAWHLFPELIRKDLIPEPHPVPEVMGLKVSGLASVRFEGFDIQVPLEIEQSAPIGLWGGDPRLCSPETGAKLVARITEIGAKFVAHYAKATP